jgi:hypothetical protein
MKKVSGFFKSAAAILAAALVLWGCELIAPNHEPSEPSAWKVTVKPLANGGITATPTQGEEGALITLSVQAHDGYILKAESLSAQTGGGTALVLTQLGSSTFSFLMPKANVVVDAAFEALATDHNVVNIPAFEGGSVSANVTSAKTGAAVTLTVSPAAGYAVKAGTLTVTAAGGAVAVSGSGTTYTFTMPGSAVTVGVEFEVLPEGFYTITVNPVTGGTVSANKANAKAGDTVVLAVTASTGYVLKAGTVKVNDGAVTVSGSGAAYSFEMPAGHVTVSAEFEVQKAAPVEYTVSVTAPEHGKISASPAKAAAGTTITLTVTPEEGYQLQAGSLKANDTAVTVSGTSYTFVMPAAAVTVTGAFEALPPGEYTVLIDKEGEGTIEADVSKATAGATVTLTVTPETGWRLQADTLKVNNGAVTVSGTGPYTFTMPAGTAKVSGVFEEIVYLVLIGDLTNGTITADPESGTAGTTITLTVTPDEGYELKGILTVTDESGGAVEMITTTTFVLPLGGVTVSGEFVELVYDVKITKPANGTITADKTSAPEKTTITLTVKPGNGYKLAAGSLKVAKDGGGTITVSGSGTTYTFALPAEDVTVSAQFEADYTAAVEFGYTADDTSELVINQDDDNALALTVTEKSTVYFTASMKGAQTITKGGADAGKVTIHTGGTVDGTTATGALAVVEVKTADLVFDGGERNFTLTVTEPGTGKVPRAIAVKLNVEPYLTGAAVFKVNRPNIAATPYADLDPLLTAGTATLERIDLDSGTNAPTETEVNILRALEWVDRNAESNSDYLIRVEKNETNLPRIALTFYQKENVTLRLRGTKGPAKILQNNGKLSGMEGYFSYNPAHPTVNNGSSIDAFIIVRGKAVFILENNIIVKGILLNGNSSLTYRHLIEIGSGVTLVMKKGSAITEHKNTYATDVIGMGVIYVTGVGNSSRTGNQGYVRIEGGSITDCEFTVTSTVSSTLISFAGQESYLAFGTFYKAASTPENPIVINNPKGDNKLLFHAAYADTLPYTLDEKEWSIPTQP